MKRILTIQDISCVGKCSITVALPIISAMGVETVVLPTAVLSAHTMFPDFTCRSLEDQMPPITAHWKKENITFDAIYTGYLANEHQIDIAADIFSDFGNESTRIIVDPVMADHGRFYAGFDLAFAEKMTGLCAKADIILPNITEAALMTGMEYRTSYDEAYIQELLKRLSDFNAEISILTGVSLAQGSIGAMGYNRTTNDFYYYTTKKLPDSYHGTGDIFASTLVGALMNGLSWQDSIPIAADYTAECIRCTREEEKPRWYGVNFEQAIPFLLKKLGKV